jgi:WD40 repeat protein
LLAAATEHQVEIWNLKTGQLTRLDTRQKGRAAKVWFSPGGQFVGATFKAHDPEMVWDLRTGLEVPRPGRASDMFCISPDGKTAAVVSTNYLVRLLDWPGSRERAVLKGHRWTIYSMAFSPDNKLLATGGGDAVARLWDLTTGRELTRPLRGHLQGVTSLAFAPDGQIIATGSTDQTVKIWHVPTGRELFTAADASEPMFSPDGNTLLLRIGQKTRLYHVPTLAEIDSRMVEADPRH